MRYILNPNIALRSWRRVPYAYYVKGMRNAQGLKKEEFEFLSVCDGKTDIPEAENNELIEKFLRSGFISEADNEATLSDWSRPCFCDNRYFPAVNWMITGKCNYNCLHCFNAADNAPLMKEWSLDEAEKFLDEAAECGINAFTITGGEPMCHKNFFEIIKGIYDRGMYVEELNTNGFYLDREAVNRLLSLEYRPLIKISFDGIGYHDWMRNCRNAEEDALRAIKLCTENGLDVKIQTNVNRQNLDSMFATAEMLDEMGAKEMRIIRTSEAPRWVENAHGMTLELTEYFDKMLEFTDMYIKSNHKMDIDIWQFLTLDPQYKEYRLRPVECRMGEYRDSLPVCRGNRGMIAVTAGGDVFPCMQISGYYEAHNDYPGNVKKDGLKKLIQQSRYLDEVCTTVGQLASINEKCGKCQYFKYCVGGCRALAFALTDDKLGSDPSKCVFFNNGYHKKIEALMGDWTNTSPIE